MNGEDPPKVRAPLGEGNLFTAFNSPVREPCSVASWLEVADPGGRHWVATGGVGMGDGSCDGGDGTCAGGGGSRSGGDGDCDGRSGNVEVVEERAGTARGSGEGVAAIVWAGRAISDWAGCPLRRRISCSAEKWSIWCLKGSGDTYSRQCATNRRMQHGNLRTQARSGRS
jgi:hypothetical protein